jgi:Tol biopolymer transport system component
MVSATQDLLKEDRVDEGDSDLGIFVVNGDGSELQNITDNECVQDQYPAWSPNGRAIAFLRRCGSRDTPKVRVFVINVDCSGARPLSQTPVDRYAPGPVWLR